MDVEYVGLGDIHPYPDNPRYNEGAVEAVAASIREFGWQQPIVVDEGGVIVCGHTRYKAACRMGLGSVPVKVARGLTPEQVAAYRLADNRTSELASWDEGSLADELAKMCDIDMGAFGFTEEELAKALVPAGGMGEGAEDAAEAPDLSMVEIDLDEACANAEYVFWSFSGGRDSTLALLSTYRTFCDMGKACQVLYVDGGCEFPDLEVHVRRVCASLGADLKVLRPDYNFLTEYAAKGRFPNPVFMDCVQKLVNKPMDDYIKGLIGDADYIMVRGGKKTQKTSRSKTARLQRVEGKPHMTIYNPAYDYTEEQLGADVPLWRGYAEGFERTACWCCPFQKKPQWDALKRCYPLLWEETRRIFETCAYPRIEGDGHPRYVERYWVEEHGVDVRWC